MTAPFGDALYFASPGYSRGFRQKHSVPRLSGAENLHFVSKIFSDCGTIHSKPSFALELINISLQ